MAIPSGARFGPYEVIAPIGTGGMGERHLSSAGRPSFDTSLGMCSGGPPVDARGSSTEGRASRAR
jgi:hypothetical protein